MNVRLSPDEVRVAIREYLKRRGLDVEIKNDIKFSFFMRGATQEEGSLVTDIIGIEQKVKEPEGPYR